MKLLLFLIPAALFACDGSPHQSRPGATNFAVDLLGDPDTRLGTWGRADAAVRTIRFRPGPGCAVLITRVYGDVIAATNGEQPAGTRAYILFGLQTSAAGGASPDADWLADNVFLYLQDSTDKSGRLRIPFDHQLNITLPPDAKLVQKVASWLNDTGLVIHIEPSYVIEYRFVEAQ